MSLLHWLAPVLRGFRAGLYESLAFYKHRPVMVLSTLLWSLATILFFLVALVFTGRVEEYAETVGTRNVLLFIPAASFLLSAMGYSVDGAALYVLWMKWNGVLDQVVVTPGAVLRIVTGASLSYLAFNLLLSSVPYYVVCAVIGGFDGVILLTVLLLLSILAGIALLGFGALLVGIVLLSRSGEVPIEWLYPVLVLLASIFYPPTLLPTHLRMVSLLIPQYHVASLVRETAALLDAHRVLSVIVLLLLLAVAYNSLYSVGAIMTRVARRRGWA